MAWYWYIAVFFGGVIAVLMIIGSLIWQDAMRDTSEHEDQRIRQAIIGFSNLIMIGLLSVIVVFLFVEMK